jgi:diaminopimelate epimerase
MKFHFYKYQATGNDFVLIDNRESNYVFTTEAITKICDRKFGIGADGLILIEPHSSLNFTMVYYNPDGSQSLCGNGCRSAVQFASHLKVIEKKASFAAFDGNHVAEILPTGHIKLHMNSVDQVKQIDEDFFINTGSPHYVRFLHDLESFPVYDKGKAIRYSPAFEPGGTNVNFAQILPDNTVYVRTYERGVENETLSCGTGVTAVAIAASELGLSSPILIKTRGGDLSVEFESGQPGMFTQIHLIGPAKMVFEGDLEL